MELGPSSRRSAEVASTRVKRSLHETALKAGNCCIYDGHHVEHLAFTPHRQSTRRWRPFTACSAFGLVGEKDCVAVNLLFDEHIVQMAHQSGSLQALESQLNDLRCLCQFNDEYAHRRSPH